MSFTVAEGWHPFTPRLGDEYVCGKCAKRSATWCRMYGQHQRFLCCDEHVPRDLGADTTLVLEGWSRGLGERACDQPQCGIRSKWRTEGGAVACDSHVPLALAKRQQLTPKWTRVSVELQYVCDFSCLRKAAWRRLGGASCDKHGNRYEFARDEHLPAGSEKVGDAATGSYFPHVDSAAMRGKATTTKDGEELRNNPSAQVVSLRSSLKAALESVGAAREAFQFELGEGKAARAERDKLRDTLAKRADQMGVLRTENDELLADNARLRRRVEALERRKK